MTQPIRRQRHGAEDRDRLLLVHGFAATGRVWESVAEELENSFEVLAPTLLGHFDGEPFPSGVAPRVDALADWLESELDAVGWDSAHIAGNSLGRLARAGAGKARTGALGRGAGAGRRLAARE